MSILDRMRQRRSIRKFKAESVSREDLEQLIEAAIAAPSGSNRQPWRFIVIQDLVTIMAARDAVAAGAQRLCGHMAEVFQNSFRSYATNFHAFAGAPALIVVLRRAVTVMSQTLAEDAPESERERLRKLEDEASLISVSMATQNVLLMAEELSLGACCMTGPLIAEPDLNRLFAVPEDWRIACLVAVGRPDEKPEPPDRRPAKKVTRYLKDNRDDQTDCTLSKSIPEDLSNNTQLCRHASACNGE